MSTAHTEPASVDCARLSAPPTRILSYLPSHAYYQTYFKSTLLAYDLDLSAKEVFSNMRSLF